VKRFTLAEEQGLEHDLENQRNWNDLVMQVQDVT
ncbi:MAG: enoyl-CoA hydratase/isomerase family protein, partial [Acidobacteriota bacterium]